MKRYNKKAKNYKKNRILARTTKVIDMSERSNIVVHAPLADAMTLEQLEKRNRLIMGEKEKENTDFDFLINDIANPMKGDVFSDFLELIKNRFQNKTKRKKYIYD